MAGTGKALTGIGQALSGVGNTLFQLEELKQRKKDQELRSSLLNTQLEAAKDSRATNQVSRILNAPPKQRKLFLNAFNKSQEAVVPGQINSMEDPFKRLFGFSFTPEIQESLFSDERAANKLLTILGASGMSDFLPKGLMKEINDSAMNIADSQSKGDSFETMNAVTSYLSLADKVATINSKLQRGNGIGTSDLLSVASSMNRQSLAVKKDIDNEVSKLAGNASNKALLKDGGLTVTDIYNEVLRTRGLSMEDYEGYNRHAHMNPIEIARELSSGSTTVRGEGAFTPSQTGGPLLPQQGGQPSTPIGGGVQSTDTPTNSSSRVVPFISRGTEQKESPEISGRIAAAKGAPELIKTLDSYFSGSTGESKAKALAAKLGAMPEEIHTALNELSTLRVFILSGATFKDSELELFRKFFQPQVLFGDKGSYKKKLKLMNDFFVNYVEAQAHSMTPDQMAEWVRKSDFGSEILGKPKVQKSDSKIIKELLEML